MPCVRRSLAARRAVALAFVVLAGLVAGAGPAAADGGSPADGLVAGAAAEVQRALDGDDGADARRALDAVLARGVIDPALLARALDTPAFARHARAALVALAAVQDVPGAGATFARIAADRKEPGIRGATFELEVAAALGADVAEIGAVVDGHEVDLLLKDGTRVEVKNDAPDDEPTLSITLSRKAGKQLTLRSAYGDPVMLVANEPLSPAQIASFRTRLGPTARMLVLSEGRLWTQLDREPESKGQRLARLALARRRPAARPAARPSPPAARPRPFAPHAPAVAVAVAGAGAAAPRSLVTTPTFLDTLRAAPRGPRPSAGTGAAGPGRPYARRPVVAPRPTGRR